MASSDLERLPTTSMKLLALLHRAVLDRELRQLIFNAPSKAAEIFGFSEDERKRLSKPSLADFEGAVGKIVAYQLLPTPLGEHFIVAPLGRTSIAFDGREKIILDQSSAWVVIGARGTSEDEGHVFGSGTHPTTQLCVHMLERYLVPGMRVLDLGTGTGILALTAAKLGAGGIVALDIDPHAVRLAEENAQRNNLGDRIHFAVGDVSWPASKGIEAFDIVVSNILAEAHLEGLELGLLDTVKPTGHLILSGMSLAGAEKVAHAVQKRGCILTDMVRIDQWYALVAQREKTTGG